MKERERVKVDFDYYVRNVRSLKAKANPNPRKLGEVRVVSNTHNTQTPRAGKTPTPHVSHDCAHFSCPPLTHSEGEQTGNHAQGAGGAHRRPAVAL